MFDPKSKFALVLGCGGVAGAAWSIAVLAELERALGMDARRADVLVGTSAGAVLAALLSAGVPVSTMVASQRGDASARCWDHDTATGGALPPRPRFGLTGKALVRAGLSGDLSLLTAACGAMPIGSAYMQPFIDLVDRFVPSGAWTPHAKTWIVTVDAATGKRVAFGREDAPEMPLNQAVCASYAVPGWCPPVAWKGRKYLDGGIASPTSADFVIGTDVRQVIVLSPMASRHPDAPSSPLARIERRARKHMTSIVDAEVNALEASGVEVFRLDPGPEDLEAFGFNMMDPKRRRRVFDTAVRTAPGAVARALTPQG